MILHIMCCQYNNTVHVHVALCVFLPQDIVEQPNCCQQSSNVNYTHQQLLHCEKGPLSSNSTNSEHEEADRSNSSQTAPQHVQETLVADGKWNSFHHCSTDILQIYDLTKIFSDEDPSRKEQCNFTIFEEETALFFTSSANKSANKKCMVIKLM